MTAVGVRAEYLSNDNADNSAIQQELLRYHDGEHDGQSEQSTLTQAGYDQGGERRRSLKSKPIKLLYITPERYSKSDYLKKILGSLQAKGMLSMFVVDEAHCMSQVRTSKSKSETESEMEMSFSLYLWCLVSCGVVH